jgi:hypothetical protein
VIASQISGATLGWIVLTQVWVLVLWFGRPKSPFARRLDQLLALLLADRLRRPARRWRAQLRAMYAQGYQVASETISSPGEVARGDELVEETVAALKAERAGGGSGVPATKDPVVVFAYGLGAWPAGADLSSLERLLAELGVSQPVLRGRFESLIRTVATANQNRDFRELAGASFVLGAAARIVEAAAAPGRSLPPPGWLATLKAHLR